MIGETDFVGKALGVALAQVLKEVNDNGYIALIGDDQVVHCHKKDSLPISLPVHEADTAPDKPKKIRRKPIFKSNGCAIAGCNKRLLAKGLCSIHYMKARREGNLPKTGKTKAAIVPVKTLQDSLAAAINPPAPIPISELCPKCNTRRKRSGFSKCQPCLAEEVA